MRFRSSILPLAAISLTMAMSLAAQVPQDGRTAPRPDPRVGLAPGWFNAGSAEWNMHLVSNTPPSSDFMNQSTPGDFRLLNSDISFVGHHVIQGNFGGYQVWDVSTPSQPRLATSYVCPGSQSDVSVWRNLMFVSAEATNTRLDCGTQGIQDTVSHDRLRGIRVFDISDIQHPRNLANVQTCRGSHTHTIVSDPRDPANIYVYVSGSAPVRSPHELEGCSNLAPDQDPNSALFRIEVIKIPLAHPEQAAIVSSPRIFQGLAAVQGHGAAASDIAAAARVADSVRRAGGFTARANGQDIVLGPGFTTPQLDSIVRARGGSGAPTAADTATLRANLQGIVDRMIASQPRSGPSQCHDITVYPAIGRAGGACGGYGLLLDITQPANPRRIGAAADSNFSFWHSATFNNDGTKVLFSDEWGGGLQPRCRATDKMEWGADAIFTLARDTMSFQGYYKMPAAQRATENCVAHNGSLIPVPGRDIMSQGFYQGGVTVFDWTDGAHPVEIAFFDRGPMDTTRLQAAGSWSAYWYNGYVYSSDLSRGLDIFELKPSYWLTQNELDAAKLVQFDYLNVQDQQKFTWPAAFPVARAYVDQLERANALPAADIAATRTALDNAERLSGARRRTALTQLSQRLVGKESASGDAAKIRTLVTTLRGIR
jgi:hypothetical protein